MNLILRYGESSFPRSACRAPSFCPLYDIQKAIGEAAQRWLMYPGGVTPSWLYNKHDTIKDSESRKGSGAAFHPLWRCCSDLDQSQSLAWGFLPKLHEVVTRLFSLSFLVRLSVSIKLSVADLRIKSGIITKNSRNLLLISVKIPTKQCFIFFRAPDWG